MFFLLKMKLVIAILCLMLVLDGVLCAKLLKKDVKQSDDEETYGDLDGDNPDIQKDQDYYTDEEGPETAPEEDTGGSDNEVDIQLISKPETFERGINSWVVLPCQASSKDELVRVWSKDSNLLFQGTINVQNRQNLELNADDGSLNVTIMGDDDYGKYTCKLLLSDTLRPEIVHEIVKRTSPTIVALYANNETNVYNVGDLLTLTCQATGRPKPRISWHRNNERLVTEGETLTIESIKPNHAGSYRCLADNSVEKPAHKHIDIYVNHKPIVSIEKYIVNSDHESDAELECQVSAYPVPAVNWQKDGQNLHSQEPNIKLTRERNNERNVLIIKDIREDDFGIYTCVASNTFGTGEQTVSLTRTPAVRNFEKSSNESTRDIILQWRVESKQPISTHELQYKKKGDKSWKTITPEVTQGENDVYIIKQTLRDLEPGVYETRARSKNKHGWSNYSDIMPFEGAKHGSHHLKPKHTKKEQKEPKTPDPTHDTPAQHRSEEISPVGESKPGSSTSLHSSIFLVILSLFATYFHIRQ